MRFTDAVMEGIKEQTIAINTSDNHSYIGRVLSIDEDNLKLSVAGAVGSTGGLLNKDRTTYISCSVITALTILER